MLHSFSENKGGFCTIPGAVLPALCNKGFFHSSTAPRTSFLKPRDEMPISFKSSSVTIIKLLQVLNPFSMKLSFMSIRLNRWKKLSKASSSYCRLTSFPASAILRRGSWHSTRACTASTPRRRPNEAFLSGRGTVRAGRALPWLFSLVNQ